MHCTLPYQAYQGGLTSGNFNLSAWWGVFFIFVLLPIIDFILGKDSTNPADEQVKKMSEEKWYRFVALLVLPAQFAMLIYGANIFATTEHFNWIGQLGWILTCGIASAMMAINVGHELIHKDNRIENWAGGLLYASVFYAGFKVEHVRGHHVHVSTPQDVSSARYGQNLYGFLPRAYLHNILNAWKLEAARLRRRGQSPFSWHNELIWWYGLSFTFLAIAAGVWGAKGAIFYLGVCFMSFTTLEIINYIEHYGLHRRKLPNGKYERTTLAHSWNSNYFLSNVGLLQLQRHSDHHAFPKRRYQVLRHYNESPQLPAGYATMYLLALVPPLWFKVMNPRVKAYYKGEEWQLSVDKFVDTVKTTRSSKTKHTG